MSFECWNILEVYLTEQNHRVQTSKPTNTRDEKHSLSGLIEKKNSTRNNEMVFYRF